MDLIINYWRKWRLKWQKQFLLAIATLLIALIFPNFALSQSPSTSDLPSPQVHPLPESLANWQDKSNSGNYLDRVESTPLGYLVWSKFPVTVYVQQPITVQDTAAAQRFRQWRLAVQKAIAEWNVYFPLQEISERESADIIILRSQPDREVKLNRDTGLYDIPRAVAAETDYKFYLRKNPTLIAHRMTVRVSPSSAGASLLATIRHELGHALGIWGHSPEKSDALYFSQVRDPLPISPRDINTLKKIYQQPTRLGWKI
ncbi:hypothetical protein [Pleurocapsa sp. PCC 7319]|uniref:hypothetical protein n=1 Tax=Pleurocapsa sp. PCC 7319 TaxID=118161 RepID=UPI00034B2F74|nr:hypothetical protein [Pleurocapsa sp. PCC 7319]